MKLQVIIDRLLYKEISFLRQVVAFTNYTIDVFQEKYMGRLDLAWEVVGSSKIYTTMRITQVLPIR